MGFFKSVRDRVRSAASGLRRYAGAALALGVMVLAAAPALASGGSEDITTITQVVAAFNYQELINQTSVAWGLMFFSICMVLLGIAVWKAGFRWIMSGVRGR
jgi:hypothetical protein